MPGDRWADRRLEIVSLGSVIEFRDVNMPRQIVLRQVQIPVAVIFDVWPLMQVLLQQVEAKQK